MKTNRLIGLRFATLGVVAAAACLLPLPLRADSSVVATVGDTPITLAEIEQTLRLPLYELEMEKYRLTKRRLDQTIVERLLARAAAARGLSVPAYVAAEIQGRIAAITQEDIETRVREDRANLPPEEDRARLEARNALGRERAGRALQELVARLAREAGVSMSLQPPDPPVVTVPIGDDPVWGPSTAPVTLIEFADFECPVCKESLPVLRQLRELYADKVRFIYRDFPLASHPQAQSAAEAAHCAHEQGQFWAYHDALFAHAPDLKSSDYVPLAEQLHLNRVEFEACLGSNRPKAAVGKDLADAQKLGLSGTPTYFINGHYLSGFQTLDALRQQIDRELMAARNGSPAPDAAQGPVSR